VWRAVGRYVNGPGLTASIWLLALAVLSINIYLVTLEMGSGMAAWVYLLFAVGGVMCVHVVPRRQHAARAATLHGLQALCRGLGDARGFAPCVFVCECV
jgi:hypothetical protein